jgi:hypothetical protein
MITFRRFRNAAFIAAIEPYRGAVYFILFGYCFYLLILSGKVILELIITKEISNKGRTLTTLPLLF